MCDRRGPSYGQWSRVEAVSGCGTLTDVTTFFGLRGLNILAPSFSPSHEDTVSGSASLTTCKIPAKMSNNSLIQYYYSKPSGK